MKVQIEGGSQISLNKGDFLSSGGEGDVYVKNSEAYKVYHDFKKMLPLGKIKELSAIKNNNVITPKKILLDIKTHKPIGYSMSFVKNTYALTSIFTKAFREREGLTHELMRDLVKNLQETIKIIHSSNIIIVDLNEMNFLVNKGFSEIFAIDTDSYQTPSYPATAIMDSIRDRHSTKFDQNTDWFSFAILAFQMFTGIHPYKGKHNIVKNFNERMVKNISVLNKEVKVPHVCYPFSVIPKTYFNWFDSVLEKGKRLPPPSSFEPVIIELSTRIISGTNNFNITEIGTFDGNILDVQYYGSNRVLTTKYFYQSAQSKKTVDNNYRLGWFHNNKDPILGKLIHGKLKLIDINNGKELDNNIAGTDLMTYNGSFYVKNNDNIIYVEIISLPKKHLVVPKIVGNILPQSTSFFDGVIVQNIVGAIYVSIFPDPTSHRQIHIKELDGLRVIDAKYDSNILIASCLKNGKYVRVTIKFDQNWNYELFFGSEDISLKPINFVVIDKGTHGVVISIVDDEVHLFLNNKNNKENIISDPIIGDDMKLFKSGSKVCFAKENKLFYLEMKK